jgi:trigger factor
MDIKVEKLPKSRVKLIVKVENDKVKPFFEKAWQDLALQVKVAGFRPGKAPKLMVIESVGLNRYKSTALDLALPQIYYDAIESEKLIPIASPNVNVIEFDEEKDFSFEAEVDLLPEIKLADYKNIKVKDPRSENKSDVKDEEVEKVVKRLLYQSAKFEDKDDVAKNGDFVEIDFEGLVDNVVKDKYTNKNYPLIIGEKVLVDGFEEKLVGKKKDESGEFKIKVDKESVTFRVKINSVKNVILPELNEEFAKKFGHDNIKNLKDAIKKSIEDEKVKESRLKLEQEIIEKIADKSKVDVPQSLVDQEVNRKITDMQKQLGVAWDKYLEKMSKTIEELRTELSKGAENQVKFGLIMGELAKDMGFITEQTTKNVEEQQKAIRKTMDALIEMMVK